MKLARFEAKTFLTKKIRFSFIETSESDESVHGGDIYGFFLANQKRFQQAIIQKGWFYID